MSDDALIEKCLVESLALLRRNMTPLGIMAASSSPEAERRHYTRIFGRDAAICALGMTLSGDQALARDAGVGLVTLAQHQADNGQIPKYVDPERKDSDFWYLGCIDATLWWLIAVDFVARHTVGQRPRLGLDVPVEKAITWLQCQEHPRLHLLQQNEASDWADIMPRSGFVLYSNALWYHVKRIYQLPYAEETKYHFNHLFFPFSDHVPEYRRLRLLRHYVRNKSENRDFYLSFVNFSFWGEEGDVFGNLLAILFGLADDGRTNRILHALERAQLDQPYPVRVALTPIQTSDSLWRSYMGRHRQNLVYQYHNGGIWPFVGGFWVIALALLGRSREARDALLGLGKANSVDAWGFHEWFHGQSGEPRGMTGQSWNAAMFVLAHYGLRKRIF
jgi:hypothetical protein